MRSARLAVFIPVVAISVIGLAPAPSAFAQEFSDGATFYVLDQESAWREGCIVGPCLCPIVMFEHLSGSFRLVELPTMGPGPWRLFELDNLRWKLRRGDQVVEIRGRGLYQTAAPVLDEQRLTLDLTIDGKPIESLDSGTVAGGLAFPKIEIQAVTPEKCYQEGVWLSAEPLFQDRRGKRTRR